MVICIIILSFFLSQPVFAEDFCTTFADASYRIMEKHQQGVSLSHSLLQAKGNKLVEQIMIDAYSSPRYGTEEYQKKAAENFRDKMHVSCLKVKK